MTTVLAALVVGCSGSKSSPATSAPSTSSPPATGAQGPEGDAFYQPPTPLPGTAPGDLIWSRPLAGLPAGAAGWTVLYRSESATGAPVAVSGVVIAPATAAPGNTVISWAHGTTGLADRCAPSKAYRDGTAFELSVIPLVLALGWTWVATDYEGLGTPGVHPYLVGQSAGRNVLDAVRAARQIEASGATAESKVVLFGHSQGGHAALMAGELAAAYAPELSIVGTVAGAPPGDLGEIERATAADPSLASGFAPMIDRGFMAAYPDLPAAAATDAAYGKVLDAVEDTCSDEADALMTAAALTSIPDASLDPAWKARLGENSPGATKPSSPVYIFHGDADTTVPASLSETTARLYCDLGATVTRLVYSGADHVSVIQAALFPVQQWVGQRLAGLPATSTC